MAALQQKMATKQTRAQRAYHAAGHAVAHLAVDKPFVQVELGPEREQGGRGVIDEALATTDWHAVSAETSEKEVFIYLAGPAVDERLRGRYEVSECERDLMLAIEWTVQVAVDADDAQQRFDRVWEQVRRFVADQHHWRQIERLARMLMRQERVAYAEALQLVTRAGVRPRSRSQ